MSRHAVLLCEGYHDRAFWAGLLLSRGWKDARGTSGRARDPLGQPVTGGRFAYRWGDSGDRFVAVVPCSGKSEIGSSAQRQFADAKQDANSDGRIDHVVACFDADAGESRSIRSIGDRWREVWGGPPPSAPPWTQDGLRVDVVFLQASDDRFSKSLDGLVARAFADAHPERNASIRAWLSTRPDPPASPSKETMWSIMAGWFAEQGCESFLQNGLWSDPALKNQILLAVDRCQLTPMLDALEA